MLRTSAIYGRHKKGDLAMNWVMIGVTVTLGIALPAMLWGAFACSRDQHAYAQHYTERGFCSELNEERVGTVGDPPVIKPRCAPKRLGGGFASSND